MVIKRQVHNHIEAKRQDTIIIKYKMYKML